MYNKILECKSAAELYNSFFDGSYGREYLFRGQGDASHFLTPGIARGKAQHEDWEGNLQIANEDGTQSFYHEASVKIARYEYRLLRDFIKACDRAGVKIPGDGVTLRESFQLSDMRVPMPFGMAFDENPFGERADKMPPNSWPNSNDFQVIIMAQHHGLETRLLDWTRSAHVAIYFACVRGMDYLAKNKDDDLHGKEIAVWAINGKSLNACEASPFYALESPTSLSININPQQGCFTTFRRGFKSEDAYNIDKCSASCGLLDKYTLKIQQAPTLYRLCLQNEYTGASLFPGPNGAVKEANERAMLKLLTKRGY